MSFLLGVWTRLQSPISVVLNKSEASGDHSNGQKQASTPVAKHNEAHRGNMKDTNKSFNKLAIMMEKEMERERKRGEKQVQYAAEKRKRKKATEGNEAEIAGMMKATDCNKKSKLKLKC